MLDELRYEWRCFEILGDGGYLNDMIVTSKHKCRAIDAAKAYVEDLNRDGIIIVGVEGSDHYFRVTVKTVKKVNAVSFKY